MGTLAIMCPCKGVPKPCAASSHTVRNCCCHAVVDIPILRRTALLKVGKSAYPHVFCYLGKGRCQAYAHKLRGFVNALAYHKIMRASPKRLFKRRAKANAYMQAAAASCSLYRAKWHSSIICWRTPAYRYARDVAEEGRRTFKFCWACFCPWVRCC